jgi:micrococcal nuclease
MNRLTILALGTAVLMIGAAILLARPQKVETRATEAGSPKPSIEPDYSPGDHYVDQLVDGETLWLRKGNEMVEVRLLGVDAPNGGDFGFKEAILELQRQLGDESAIRLEHEEVRKDDKGKTLAYLFIDGRNVNVEMVRSGWAKYFDGLGEGRYRADFRKAAEEAKRGGLGIWANR